MSKMPKQEPERCCCGRDLHYSSPSIEAIVKMLIVQHGPTIPIQVVGMPFGYRVPRHYIALHGLDAQDLPALAHRYGWERVSIPMSPNWN